MKRALFRASQAGHPVSRHSPFRTAVGIERPDHCAVPGSGRAPPRAHAGAPGSRIRGEHGAAIMGGLAGEGLGAPVEGVPPRASVRCRNTGSADARCVRRGAGSRQPIRRWPVTASARRAPPAAAGRGPLLCRRAPHALVVDRKTPRKPDGVWDGILRQGRFRYLWKTMEKPPSAKTGSCGWRSPCSASS